MEAFSPPPSPARLLAQDSSIADPQTRRTWARLGQFQQNVKDLRLEVVKLRSIALQRNGGAENAQVRQLSKFADELKLIYRSVPTSGTKATQDAYVNQLLRRHRRSYSRITKHVEQYRSKFGVSATASRPRPAAPVPSRVYQAQIGNYDRTEMELYVNGARVAPGSSLRLPSSRVLNLRVMPLSSPRKIGRRGNTSTITVTQNSPGLVAYRSNRLDASTRLRLLSEDCRWGIRDIDNNWVFRPRGDEAYLKTDGNGTMRLALQCSSTWESVSRRGGSTRSAREVSFTMPTQVLRLVVSPGS